MIRARACTGDVVHLWVQDPITASGRALCGEVGPGIEDQAGNLCAACWRIHGGLLGSAFGRAGGRGAALTVGPVSEVPAIPPVAAR
jgi:hypothetical protein